MTPCGIHWHSLALFFAIEYACTGEIRKTLDLEYERRDLMKREKRIDK